MASAYITGLNFVYSLSCETGLTAENKFQRLFRSIRNQSKPNKQHTQIDSNAVVRVNSSFCITNSKAKQGRNYQQLNLAEDEKGMEVQWLAREINKKVNTDSVTLTKQRIHRNGDGSRRYRRRRIPRAAASWVLLRHRRRPAASAPSLGFRGAGNGRSRSGKRRTVPKWNWRLLSPLRFIQSELEGQSDARAWHVATIFPAH